MDYENEIYQLKKENQTLSEKIDFLEFKLELLAEDSNVSKLLFECNITRSQYIALMDLMDNMRNKLDHGEEPSNYEFEIAITSITGTNDYHFAEYIAKAFMEEDRWEEVFPALYGHMLKYQNYLERYGTNN